MSIETKHFVATNSDIEKLVTIIIDNDLKTTTGRGNYLKALVATTQAELGSPPRQRNVKAERLTDEEVLAHTKAFQAVAGRFFAIVEQVAENTVPAPDSAMVRQRTGFARSAASTVRGYIRAGNDIRALAAHRATKAALASLAAPRKVSAEALGKKVGGLLTNLESAARDLLSLDPDMAKEVLSAALARLAVAVGATDNATSNADKALSQHIPLKNHSRMFVPVNLADVREARRAAA